MKIELDEGDVNAILDAVCNQIADLEDTLTWMGEDTEAPALRARVQLLAELDMDIREQAFRRDDWDTDLESTDLTGRVFSVPEEDFIKMGIDAREQAKLNNRLKHSTVSAVDVWSLNGLED